MGGLCGVFCEYLWKKRYNDTALYHEVADQKNVNVMCDIIIPTTGPGSSINVCLKEDNLAHIV